MILHRLNPEHHKKQALAAHYLERAAEFQRNVDDSEAEHWVNMWSIARDRQLGGARHALNECGCKPRDWTAEVRRTAPGVWLGRVPA